VGCVLGGDCWGCLGGLGWGIMIKWDAFFVKIYFLRSSNSILPAKFNMQRKKCLRGYDIFFQQLEQEDELEEEMEEEEEEVEPEVAKEFTGNNERLQSQQVNKFYKNMNDNK